MTFASLAQHSNTKMTPQTLPSPNAPVLQVKNNAGGFVFELNPEKQLDRFLILGTTGGTYYQTESDLTRQNITDITKLIKENGVYVVNRVVEISDAGRARNNDYALLILAKCFAEGDAETKAAARKALPLVARTGTHLMHFVGFANGMRGWGSSLKKAVADWYNSKNAEDIAYQAVKYQQRDGWSQRDVLRLAHPKTDDAKKNDVYKYITHGAEAFEGEYTELPSIIYGFEQAKTAEGSALVKLIQNHRLTMEMVPTAARNQPEVWEALLPNMGATALIRNLNKMTAIGLIDKGSDAGKFVVEQLTDRGFLRRNRVHPLQLLVAQKIYGLGRGDLGSLTWVPDRAVLKALEDAFYLSFDTLIPSGKRTFKALDVSGSMNSKVSGASVISCREGAAVLAMVSARQEENSVIYGFDHQFRDLGISRTDDLPTVLKKTFSARFGSTDCSLPMMYAAKSGMEIDQFEVYTDNETYHGAVHPFEALNKYRKKVGRPDVKLAVIAMTASRFSIANPKDPFMMDLVGFDTATPAILSDFAAGVL